MKRILLIEPEFYKRVELEDVLSPQGFQVSSVKDRYSALMKLKSQVFNIIMTCMKEDPGELFFLLQSLRDSGSVLPVVILAQSPTMAVIQKLSRFNPIEVIVQPFAFKHLVTRLNLAVRKNKR